MEHIRASKPITQVGNDRKTKDDTRHEKTITALIPETNLNANSTHSLGLRLVSIRDDTEPH